MLLEKLKTIDTQVWRLIHVQGQSYLLDFLCPLLRNPKTWIPLYLFLALFIPYRYGKKGFFWCLGFIVTFGIGDYTSASIIKPLIKRIRPCNDANLQSILHHLVDCGSGYSFPSAHATNHFALAWFMMLTIGQIYRWIKLPAILWAISVAYAQVYVGVHYPGDVLAGAILGAIIGCFTANLFNKKIGLNNIIAENKK